MKFYKQKLLSDTNNNFFWHKIDGSVKSDNIYYLITRYKCTVNDCFVA